MKQTNKEVARQIVAGYFQNLMNMETLNPEGIRELILIKNDDRILLEHIKAQKKILEDAIEEIEDELKRKMYFYTCSKCGFEWESSGYEITSCGKCGSGSIVVEEIKDDD